MMTVITHLVVLFISLLFTWPTTAADVNTCGVLLEFTRPTETNNVGRATVGDKTWNLSGTPGPNNVSPQATVGSRVCLSGELALSQTLPDLLARWTLAPDVSASASPVPTTSPATIPIAVGILAATAVLAMLVSAVIRRGPRRA